MIIIIIVIIAKIIVFTLFSFQYDRYVIFFIYMI